MIDLHPPDCGCGDCRNRRLICGVDSTTEDYLADEWEPLGSVQPSDQAGSEDERWL